MHQVLDCRKYWMGCLTDTLWCWGFLENEVQKIISAWSCINLNHRDMSTKKRILGYVSGWHKVCPEEQMQQLNWAKLAQGVCTPSAFGIPVAGIWECPVQTSLTWAWIWEAEIGSRKACGNGEMARKSVLRGENLGSSLCLAENRRGLSWFCCDLYVAAGCTSWKPQRGKFISETRTPS